MLAPYSMLTTKNWDRHVSQSGLVLFIALVLNGCTPSGPRILLDGERLIHQQRFPEAIDRLKIATQLLPENAQAWNHLGLAYHGAGAAKEAAHAYQQALRRNPNLAAPHYNLGVLALEENDLQFAILELTSFTVLQRDSAEGWLKRGTAELRARQFDVAEKSFQNALHL